MFWRNVAKLIAIYDNNNETHSAKAEEYWLVTKIKDFDKSASGGNNVKVTPLTISNRKVKLHSAQGTAGEALWESRSLPGKYMVH